MIVCSGFQWAQAEETHTYRGSIFQYGDEEWNCRVVITWMGEGSISGTVKIGDHTVDLSGINPDGKEIEFTTRDEDGVVDVYKLTKTSGDPETWSGKRNDTDRISFRRQSD